MKSKGFLVATLAAALCAPAMLATPATARAATGETSLDGARAQLEALAPADAAGTAAGGDMASLAGAADELSASLAGSAPGASALAVEDFPDCAADAWYSGPVTYVSDHGLITGRSDGTFAPAAAVSRADLVTILWRMAGAPQVTSAGFPDLTDPGAYYYQAALWARSAGVVSGVNHADGLQYFDGASAVTREQCAAMLARYAKLCGLDTSSDGSALRRIPGWETASAWAMGDLGWAVDEGLLSGQQTSAGKHLDPLGTTSRAAAASMITVLHRDLLAGRTPGGAEGEPQTEAEKNVLSGLQAAIDLLNASGDSSGLWQAYIAGPTSYWDRSFFITLESDVSFAEVRAAYRQGGETLLRLDETAASFDALSGTVRDLSVSQGAGLDGFAVLYSSDGEVIHASKNGEYFVPYWYTLE